MKLNDTERAVLTVLAEDSGGDEEHSYLSFAPIMEVTGLPRKRVRRACRSLARKGLAAYGRGLFCDDGLPYGAGYRATTAGVEAWIATTGGST